MQGAKHLLEFSVLEIADLLVERLSGIDLVLDDGETRH
jgi:hypothetical protein